MALLAYSLNTNAQGNDPVIEIIHALKSGTLWVVLPTHQKKISALHQQIRKRPTDQRPTTLLQQTMADRDSFNISLRKAMEKNYHFSAFRFIPDSALPVVLDSLRDLGENRHYFLDHTHTENGAGALVLSDLTRHHLKKPLPYYVRTARVSSLFDTIFGGKDEIWKHLSQAIKKLDDRLRAFYTKYQRQGK